MQNGKLGNKIMSKLVEGFVRGYFNLRCKSLEQKLNRAREESVCWTEDDCRGNRNIRSHCVFVNRQKFLSRFILHIN